MRLAFWTAVLVALIAFSRVFIGVHFGTDIVGGLLLGLFWLLVGLALAERRVTARPIVLASDGRGATTGEPGAIGAVRNDRQPCWWTGIVDGPRLVPPAC